ncbi:MAG: hypothetical protein KKA73_10340, partial [Chloroflexi bacterium]|nr:hypothetical protein [Chloroflexota bacterium]
MSKPQSASTRLRRWPDLALALAWAVLVGLQAAAVFRAPELTGAVLVGANALVGVYLLLRRPAGAQIRGADLLLVPLGLLLPTLWRAEIGRAH